MQGNGLPRNIKVFSNGIEVKRCFCNKIDNFSSGWVGDRLEYISPDFHNMQVFACKYICKYLLAQFFLNNLFTAWNDLPGFLLQLVRLSHNKL